MDFIERIFGVSPDGGDGSTEMMWIAAIAFAVIALGFARWVRRRNRV